MFTNNIGSGSQAPRLWEIKSQRIKSTGSRLKANGPHLYSTGIQFERRPLENLFCSSWLHSVIKSSFK